ncbi:hypothetical protein PKB_5482 [Pseudomonas knackmussii B13]|uniref:Nucleotide modification associated domain-containing protein n=2 Tax=Pseudomonas knackmussii TaxID=65741 RepID=A0A024HQD6_PSEKB|nr:hypothetical protein PKB_5482 [Pseudomonas knackmussii B13]
MQSGGQVSAITHEVQTFTEYWKDRRFASKKPDRTVVPDNFYKPVGNGLFTWQPNLVHGPEAQDRDTGGLNVLVFDHAWRFGAFGPVMPEGFGLRMNFGRRGERVADLTESEWRRLETWLNAQPQVTVEAASDRKSSPSCTPRALPGSSQPFSRPT